MGLFGAAGPPDPTKAAVKGSLAELANYPFKTQIDALAQMGGKATIGGQLYDFSGLGTADQNAKISDQMAQAMLDIQKNYGAAYIKQRLADLQQSDPTGYAARKQLFDKILADAQSNPDRPMAQDTQDAVLSLLGQGSQLSTGAGSQTEAVQQGVRGKQIANGIFLGNAPVNEESAALVNTGDQMQQQRQAQAQGFLNSGVSPEDVTYRRIQQSLSNLGNFANGTSPTAQFASLSGAQGGAAPFNGGNPTSPQMNPNAAMQGLQNAQSIYSGNVNWQNSQANPWTAGLSTAGNAVGALKSMGAFNSSTMPTTGQSNNALGEFYGTSYLGMPSMAGLNAGMGPVSTTVAPSSFSMPPMGSTYSYIGGGG